MEQKIGVGIIGMGFIGTQYHGPSYLKLKNVNIEAICDVDKKKLENASEKLGVEKKYSDYHDLIRDPKIDMVDICVPAPWHEMVTVESAENGKHVLCEKPIALDLKAANNMIKAGQKAGVKFMVAHSLRFHPPFIVTKKILDEGTIGKPLLASISDRNSMPSWTPWFPDPKISGGAVIDEMCHDADQLNWYFGHPQSVYALGLKSNKGAWDHVFTSIVYSNKGKGFAETSFFMPEGFPFTYRVGILGQEGSIEVLWQKKEDSTDWGRGGMIEKVTIYRPGKKPESPQLPVKERYFAEIEYFVNCVKEDQQPTISPPEDSRSALEVALAAKKSIENNRIVQIE